MKQAAHRSEASAPQSDHRPFFRQGGEGVFFAKGSTQAKPVDGGQVIQRMPKEDLKSALYIAPEEPDEETLAELESLTNKWEKGGADWRENSARKELVEQIIGELADEAYLTGQNPEEGWVVAVRVRLELATQTARNEVQAQEKSRRLREADNLRDFEEQQERQRLVREARDRDALVDPHMPEYVETGKDEDPEYKVRREAAMGDFKVLLLEDANYSISTDALSSCTGLAIYDPQSQVGALIHVFTEQDYPKISGAMLEEMKHEAKRNSVELGSTSGFQASIMPGISPGVNMSHIACILSELKKAGITHIRNLAEEGRLSGSFRLIGGGKITNK